MVLSAVLQGGAMAGHVACLFSMTQGKVKKWLYIYNMLKRLSVLSVVFSVSFFFHIINLIVWSFG